MARNLRDTRRRYVQVGNSHIHYRTQGSGPAVVLLHDSPRSSRLHLETIQYLSRDFQVFALDTSGYGNSDPLPQARPTIRDFADKLGETLAALGLTTAPLYATHTSAKIAVEYAANSGTAPLVILDGLSIPAGEPNPAFISQYMRPFEIEATGGYLATEWTRMRDMVRWFPWFNTVSAARMPIALPEPDWVNDYIIDFFAAGPNYSSAYAAAMYYSPMEALKRVTCPVLVAAKSDDVLYSFLDKVPVDANPALRVERLSADREEWRQWLRDRLASAAGAAPADLMAQPDNGAIYLDLSHGQMQINRTSHGDGQPLLILEAGSKLHASRWQAALGDRPTLAPELPGFGESDALPAASLETLADSLIEALDSLGLAQVDLLGLGFATPLAAKLAERHPQRIGKVVLDGCFDLGDADAAHFSQSICPTFAYDHGGGHIHQYWHMLRDSEASWPWYSLTAQARRGLDPVLDAKALHESLVGILKQPATYGDAVRAGCDVERAGRYAAFGQQALVFSHDSDPAYGGAALACQNLANARLQPRPQTLEEAATLVGAFLSGRSQ